MVNPAPHGGILFRVFEGSDCHYRYVSGETESTDRIVWGTPLYNVRVRWRPMDRSTLLNAIVRIAKRKGGGEANA